MRLPEIIRRLYFLFVMVLSAQVIAEQEYFTWVDAQGRIHNTPVERKEKNSQAPPLPESSFDESESIEQPIVDGFLTEEEFEEKREQYESDNPPFYTFVDETGRLRAQPIIDSEIVVEESYTPQTFDHILAPPFRVPAFMKSQCCSRYQNYFKENVPADKKVNFTGFLNAVPLSTKEGAKPAWYISLDRSPKSVGATLDLSLTFRGLDETPIALIAVDAQYRALHFIPALNRISHPESWLGAPYQQADIRSEDPLLAGFIVYFPQGHAASASMDVEWHYGKTSD